jgi:hypothetical protein
MMPFGCTSRGIRTWIFKEKPGSIINGMRADQAFLPPIPDGVYRRISDVFRKMLRSREWKNEARLGNVRRCCKDWPFAESVEAV